jgi:hypothetical protein
VNQAKSGKLVLILDDDLGFVMWLGQVLSRAGMVPVPAMSGHDALGRIRELKIHLDLALINPRAPGATEFIQKIADQTPVYTLESAASGGRGVLKRFTADEPASDKWVQKVKRALVGS